MAIYPYPNASPPHPINIQAWTEEATQSLNAVSLVSPGDVPGTNVSLAIELDESPQHNQNRIAGTARRADNPNAGSSRYREPLRRDSLKRRDALLKGKEGSRRRTRWENGSYHTWSI